MIELLGDRDKRDPRRVEDFDDFCEIRQRPGQPVHFVDDDHVDQVRLDIGQQPLEGWSVRRSAGISPVVVEDGKGRPALVPLAFYIGLTGLALRMKRIEILFQPLFG